MRPLHPRRARGAAVSAAMAVAVVLGMAQAPAQAAEIPGSEDVVRLVVLSERSADAGDLARNLIHSPLARRGLRVVSDAGRSAFTVEVAAGEVQAATESLEARSDVAAVAPVTAFSLLDVPDDPRYPDQATYLKALDLPKAWTLTHGSASVKVAVVDSGVDVTHPDLAGKIVGTYNATDDSADVRDDEGHGTAVASMAAAQTDNGKVLAGAGWNTSILAVKVEDDFGSITNESIAKGLRWAVLQGADVINLSLGGTLADPATKAAVAEAVAAGVVVVAAAGNSGATTKFYPAAYPKVLAVGATGSKGKGRAGFSQHGSWVDVGAPGESIVGAEAGTSSYVVGDGTSFSAPLVSGVAALVRAFRPELTQGQVRAAITSTANDADLGFAHGLVDAAAALRYRPSFPGPHVADPAGGAAVSRNVDVAVSGVTDPLVTSIRARLIGGGPTVTGAVTGGSADLVLPTIGSSGPENLLVTTCRKTVCSPTGTTVPVVVSNPEPTITAPVDGSELQAAFTVTADGVSAIPAVRFLADGKVVLGTDTTAPFEVPVSIHDLAPGAHTLTAVSCDAKGTTCATDDPSAPVQIEVSRLSPSVTGVRYTPFSPNADGHKDKSRVTYRLDVASDVTVSVLRADGSEFRRRHLGSQGKGVHTWIWNGYGIAGASPRSGTYTVVIATEATVGGKALVGEARRVVVVDLGKPRLTKVGRSHGRVFPVKDHYVDAVALSVTVGEPAAAVAVRVVNAGKHTVWHAARHSTPKGKVSFTFKGRRASGALLAPGIYRFTFTVTDRAGNVRTSHWGSISVSGKRLSGTRTGHRTVSAYGSFDYYVVENEDDGSQVWRTRWSSGSLLWDPSGGAVMSVHHVKLPGAAVFGSVEVDAFGRGKTSGARAYLFAFAPDGSIVHQSRYSAGTGNHRGDRVALAKVLKGQKVSWGIGVYGQDRYEIKTFTVSWTYRVLV